MHVNKTLHGFGKVVEDGIEACNRRIMPEPREFHDDRLGSIERYMFREFPSDRTTIVIIMVSRVILSSATPYYLLLTS
jgi:hypothetical protein